jgi:hypothetical protein
MEEGRSGGEDGVGGGESGGRGMAMGMFGFSVAEVGSGGRESTVDVSPGTRRTTSFSMLFGFWEHEGVKDVRHKLERPTCTLIQLGGGASAMT